MELQYFEIKSMDKRNYVNIPYRLKDDFKNALKSAKWDPAEKCWYVGPRSLKKLKAWIEDNGFDAESYEREQEQRRNAFREKLAKSKPLSGKTYKIKEELKERFDAFFHKDSWYVPVDRLEEAQAFVDAANSNAITKERIKESIGDVQKVLVLLEDISKNFIHDGSEYGVEDEIGDYIRFSHSEDNDVYNALHSIGEDIFYLSQEAEERGSVVHSFDNKLHEILKILRIPEHVSITDDGKINDFAEEEDGIIDDLVAKGSLFLVDREEASKFVVGVGGQIPIFCFRSKITGKCYDVRPKPKLTSHQTSSRVTEYAAKEIPVLKSEDFETVMKYWRNRKRTCVINLKTSEE